MALVLITGFLLFSMRGASHVPSRVQSVGEVCYEFIANMVRDSAGHEGMKYFPVIFTIFVFVLALNILGMIPLPGLGNFTVTSHLIVTFGLAAFVWIGVTLIGIAKHGLSYPFRDGTKRQIMFSVNVECSDEDWPREKARVIGMFCGFAHAFHARVRPLVDARRAAA